MEELSADFNYDELVQDLYAKTLILEKQVHGLLAFQKILLEELSLDKSTAEELHKGFRKTLNEQIESLKTDNPIINQILNKQIKKDLGNIPGIDFSV